MELLNTIVRGEYLPLAKVVVSSKDYNNTVDAKERDIMGFESIAYLEESITSLNCKWLSACKSDAQGPP